MPNVLGAHLLSEGPLGLGAWCGAQAPRSWRTSVIVIILPFVVHPPRGMGPDYTTSPSLLPVSLWFLLYIFSRRRPFLPVFQSFFCVNSCSVNSCSFGVPVGRGELSVFLLKDILPDEQNFHLFSKYCWSQDMSQASTKNWGHRNESDTFPGLTKPKVLQTLYLPTTLKLFSNFCGQNIIPST